MNRAIRRKLDKKKKTGVQDLAALVERVKPYLEIIEPLTEQLKSTNAALQEAQAENSELRNILEEQRQVFLRMFATGMDIPLEQVRSLETRISNEVNNAFKISLLVLSGAERAPGTA